MQPTLENTGDAIGASIALTRGARQELTGEVTALDHRIAGIGGQWVGQSAVAFGRVHAAWTDQVQRLMTALDEFADNLTGTERFFDVTDADVDQAMAALRGRLG